MNNVTFAWILISVLFVLSTWNSIYLLKGVDVNQENTAQKQPSSKEATLAEQRTGVRRIFAIFTMAFPLSIGFLFYLGDAYIAGVFAITTGISALLNGFFLYKFMNEIDPKTLKLKNPDHRAIQRLRWLAVAIALVSALIFIALRLIETQ